MARLEGAYEQVSDRLTSIDRRLDGFEQRVESRFDGMERRMDARFSNIDASLRWAIGMIFGSWLTTMLAIFFHR